MLLRTLIASALALFLVAFGPQPNAPPPTPPTPESQPATVIGFIPIGGADPGRTAQAESIKAEAAKRKFTLKTIDGTGQQVDQRRAIRRLINEKASAIILAPVVESGWDGMLVEAKKANIPIVLLDRAVHTSDPTLYATMIGSDAAAQGRLAGEWLVKKLDGRGSVFEIAGTVGSVRADLRHKGFAGAIENHPDIKIFDSKCGAFSKLEAKKVMEAALKTDRDKIKAVYAQSDEMALGAIQAIEEAGLKPGQDIFIVSIDGLREAVEAVAAGKLNATVDVTPLTGPAVFEALEKVLKHEAVPKWIKTPDHVLDQAAAAEELKTRKH